MKVHKILPVLKFMQIQECYLSQISVSYDIIINNGTHADVFFY